MDEELLFKIEPIGKLDVDGIRLILNHTEISTDYDETNTTNEYSDDNKDNDEEEDDEDDDEEEYKDAKNDNISTNSSTSQQYTSTSNNNNNNNNIDTDWLSKMSIDITSDNQMMVIGGGGNGSIGTGLALILTRKLNDPTSWRTLITLDHQTTNGTDRITSIQFVPINLHLINYVVAVGYTSGYLRVFSIQGNLLLSQLFYNKPVLKIKVKNTSTLPIGDIVDQQKYVVHELTLVYPDNIVVNISGVTFMSIVQVCFNQSQRGNSGDGSNNLSFKKWTLGNSVERVNDVTFCGPFLGSPFRALPYSTTEQSMIRLVAVGSNPMISFYYPSEDGGQSFSVMISSITSRLTTAVFSYAKNWWGGGNSNQQSQQSSTQSSLQKQPHQEKPIPLAIRWAITDTKREILSILNDPSGRYAVSTDNLGRILLIDLVNSLVVKMWKGYRDCQCGFINVVENCNNNNETSTSTGGGEDQDFVKIDDEPNEDLEDFIPKKLLKKQSTKQPQSRTYLVIYLGRRGILEIWGLKHRSREFFKTIGHGCKLISTATPSIFQNQHSNLRNSGGNYSNNSNNNNSNNNNSKYNIKEGQSHCFIIHSNGSVKEIKYNAL